MSHAAHVAIDARMIDDGGIGTYVRNLVPRLAALRPDWRFTALGNVDRLTAAGWGSLPNVRLAPLRAPIYGVAEQIEFLVRAPRNASVFWSPHYNVPLTTRAKLVATVHDACHLALPETIGPLRSLYARFMFRAVRQRASAVLFDSAFSREETERLAGCPAGIARVSHLGIEEDWFDVRARFRDSPLAEPYLLYVGNMKRHKNVPALLRAFAAIRHAVPHRLVLVGRRDGLRADPAIDPAAATVGDRAYFAGELPRADLQRWVAHATACVTASTYEGFGLPALEAMAAGCPYVSTRSGSLPEICGDAAVYCDAHDENSIASALQSVACDEELRRRHSLLGVEHARSFSWNRCAGETLEMIERVMS